MTLAAPPAYPDDPAYPTHATAGDILTLTETGPGRYRAAGGVKNHLGTIFGGRLIGQALQAASQTVADMPATSLHAYFLAAGQVDLPVDYVVTTLRDSRRFANRQVTARQADRTIFTLMAGYHAAETGFDHQQAAMPDVPPPEAVMPLQQFVALNQARIDPSAVRNFSGATPIELRPIAPEVFFFERSSLPRTFWFRLASAGTAPDVRSQQCLLAYASDYWLAGVAAVPHVFPTNGKSLLISSMDHAMWFHRPARCDEWLLHHTESASAGDGLAIAQGRIFDRSGRLVATSTQECLLRKRTPA